MFIYVLLIWSTCVMGVLMGVLFRAEAEEVPAEAAVPHENLRGAVRRTLADVLLNNLNTNTAQVIEVISRNADLPTTALNDSLLVYIDSLIVATEKKEGRFTRLIDISANKAGLRPDKARQLVNSLLMRMHEIIEKDQNYVMSMLVEKEVGKIGIQTGKGKAFLLQLIQRTSPTAVALDQSVLAVLVFDDKNPFGWENPPPLISDISFDSFYILWHLVKEVDALSIFKYVTRYDKPMEIKEYPPTFELILHGAWFARNLSDEALKEKLVNGQIPICNGEPSERDMKNRRGLMMRYEIREIASKKILAEWCSFCEVAFQEARIPVFKQSLVEKKYIPLLVDISKSDEPVLSQPTQEDTSRSDKERGQPAILDEDRLPREMEETTQIARSGGLIVEGRSTFDIDGLRRTSQIESTQENPLLMFYGSSSALSIDDKVKDIHQQVVSVILKQIDELPLKHVKWNGDYKLSIDIMALDFDLNHETQVGERQSICTLQVGVWLSQISSGKTLFKQTPPLVVQFKKATPGGKGNLDLLCADVARQVLKVVNDYWFENEGRLGR